MLAFRNRTKLWDATSTPILQVEALYISLVMLGSGQGYGKWEAPGLGLVTQLCLMGVQRVKRLMVRDLYWMTNPSLGSIAILDGQSMDRWIEPAAKRWPETVREIIR